MRIHLRKDRCSFQHRHQASSQKIFFPRIEAACEEMQTALNEMIERLKFFANEKTYRLWDKKSDETVWKKAEEIAHQTLDTHPNPQQSPQPQRHSS